MGSGLRRAWTVFGEVLIVQRSVGTRHGVGRVPLRLRAHDSGAVAAECSGGGRLSIVGLLLDGRLPIDVRVGLVGNSCRVGVHIPRGSSRRCQGRQHPSRRYRQSTCQARPARLIVDRARIGRPIGREDAGNMGCWRSLRSGQRQSSDCHAWSSHGGSERVAVLAVVVVKSAIGAPCRTESVRLSVSRIKKEH